jgi:hypothetical protein
VGKRGVTTASVKEEASMLQPEGLRTGCVRRRLWRRLVRRRRIEERERHGCQACTARR